MWFDEETLTDCGRITGDSSLILVTEELLTIWELGGSVNTTAFVESNRAIAVSNIHVFIRLGPAFRVEDWYVRSGGRHHLLSMIRSR